MNNPPSPLWKRLLRFLLFAFVVLVTLAFLAGTWISFQGRRDWAKTKADLLARGEKLSYVELIPPSIPASENFFADPMWQELADVVDTVGESGFPIKKPRIPDGQRQLDQLDFPLAPGILEKAVVLVPELAKKQSASLKSTDVSRMASTQLGKTRDPAAQQALARLIIEAQSPSEALLARIQFLLMRPHAVFPLNLSNGLGGISYVYLNYLLKLAQAYSQRARAHLAMNESAKAASEVATVLRLADCTREAPFLLSALVHMSIVGIVTSTIDSGIADHRWNDSELAQFETLFRQVAILPDMAANLRGERGMFNQSVEAMGKKIPDQTPLWPGEQDPKVPAWKRTLGRASYQFLIKFDQASYNRYLQNLIDMLQQKNRIDPQGFPTSTGSTFYRLTHFTTAMAAPSLEQALARAVFTQNSVSETRIACALERYRLKNGAYPASLAALAPGFLPVIPESALTADTFHYRRDNGDTFTLWSNGWNLANDQGTASSTKGIGRDGDWVWNLPPGSKRR